MKLKLLAARRLGEIRSVRAVPALIREFRTIAGTPELERLHDYAYQVFQEALMQIGTAWLPDLVRSMDFTGPSLPPPQGASAAPPHP